MLISDITQIFIDRVNRIKYPHLNFAYQNTYGSVKILKFLSVITLICNLKCL